MTVDWSKIREDRDAAKARYDAMPKPSEDTIEACLAALKAEDFGTLSVGGKSMTLDEVYAAKLWPFGDWYTLLRDWRYLRAEEARKGEDRPIPERVQVDMPADSRMNITLVAADITTLKVDVIVNAANEIMLGGGGVDAAIHRAAGPKLLEACRSVWADPGLGNGPGLQQLSGVRCPTGEVRPTPAFNLPAKWVFHTVGPVWPKDEDAEMFEVDEVYLDTGKERRSAQLATGETTAGAYARQLLRDCYKKSALIAVGMGLKSIAFPALSAGVYGCPMEVCAEVALRWAMDYRHWPIDVTFAIYPSRHVQTWADALTRINRS